MNTTALIKRFLLHHPLNELFTTRDVLRFGDRSSVDTCMYELVRDNELIRVARGIFVKVGSTRTFTNLELAKIKAESFGRKLIPHPSTFDTESPSNELHDPNETVFGISGFSTSFMYGKVRIYLRAVISRKSVLSNTKLGAGVNHLWTAETWDSIETSKVVWKVCRHWGANQRIEFASMCGLMPWWIVDHFVEWFEGAVALQLRKGFPANG